MSVEDGAKLYDICPHVSDSVSSPAASGWARRRLLLHGCLLVCTCGVVLWSCRTFFRELFSSDSAGATVMMNQRGI